MFGKRLLVLGLGGVGTLLNIKLKLKMGRKFLPQIGEFGLLKMESTSNLGLEVQWDLSPMNRTKPKQMAQEFQYKFIREN